jgi:hypothetical protein
LRPHSERPGDLERSSPLPCKLHRLDRPSGCEARSMTPSRSRRPRLRVSGVLADREPSLELLQVRVASTRDGRENTELGHPQAARSQEVVVELRHRAETVRTPEGESTVPVTAVADTKTMPTLRRRP